MKIKIEKKIISEKSPIYFIGEIGVNHNGSLSLAKKLISKAKKCGCSAVKFQIYKTENLVLKNTKLAKYQKKTGKKNMFDMLKKYELSFDKFKII